MNLKSARRGSQTNGPDMRHARPSIFFSSIGPQSLIGNAASAVMRRSGSSMLDITPRTEPIVVHRCTQKIHTHCVAGRLHCCVAISFLLLYLLCSLPAIGADSGSAMTAYDDALEGGWANWSYSAGEDLSNSTPVQSGTHSIRLDMKAWGGLYFHHAPLNAANYSQVSFAVHGGTQGGQPLALEALDSQGKSLGIVRLASPVAGQWRAYAVNLADLHAAGAVITGLVIRNYSAANAPTFYVDNVALTMQPPSVAQVLYDDALQSGWVDWSWAATHSLDNTTPSHSGAHSIAVNLGAWGALYFHHSTFQSTGYYQISFWAHGGSHGGQQLQIVVYDANSHPLGTVALPALAAGKWNQYAVALSSLNAANRPISGILLQNRGPQPTQQFYVDDIRLEPARGLGARDFILYDHALRNAWQDWSWNQHHDLANAGPVEDSNASIAVTVNDRDQGLTWHHDMLSTAPFAALSMLLNGGTAAGHILTVQGVLSDGTEMPAVSLPPLVYGAWFRAEVPLSKLGLEEVPNLQTIVLRDTSAGPSSATFYLDNWALLERSAPERVSIQIDPRITLKSVDTRLAGINEMAWDRELSTPAVTRLLRDANVGSLRFPGGSTADLYDWSTGKLNGKSSPWAAHSATFAAQAAQLGVPAVITVNYGDGTSQQAAAWVAWANGAPSSNQEIGVDSRRIDWHTVGYWASLRAAPVRNVDDGRNFLRAAHPAPYGWRYWEVGNEMFGSWENDQHGVPGSGLVGRAHDPLTYGVHAAEFMRAMKAVDPTVEIGVVIVNGGSDRQRMDPDDFCIAVCDSSESVPSSAGGRHYGWNAVVLHALSQHEARPDFLAFHFYAQGPGHESDTTLLAAADFWPLWNRELHRQIAAYWSGKDPAAIQLAATEINSVTGNPGKQTVSLVNGLFYADCMGRLLQTDFTMAQWWAMRSDPNTAGNNSGTLYGARNYGSYGVVSDGGKIGSETLSNNEPYPVYHILRQLVPWRAAGAKLVRSSTSDPTLAAYATLQSDGRLTVLVLNKSPTAAITGDVSLSGFIAGTRELTVSTYGRKNEADGSGPTTSSYRLPGSSFSYVFEPYSSTLLTVPRS
jgi:alpha-L-arabinofuranosidase